jgi:uncharacterized membrane protein
MRLGDTDRLEAFSDGVMAVIITIMAFNVKPPSQPTWSSVHEVVPHLLVYALSFVMIGIYWNNHHHLLRATESLSASVMWTNLFLLFWLSMLPIVTDWVGVYPNHSLPAATYGFVALGAGFAYYVLVRAIIKANGQDSLVAKAVGRDRKGLVSEGLYALGIGLAFTPAPGLAYVAYAAVSVLWFIPDRRFSAFFDADQEAATTGDGTSS